MKNSNKLSIQDEWMINIPVPVLKEVYKQAKDFPDNHSVAIIVPRNRMMRVEDEILSGRISPDKMTAILHDKRNKRLIEVQEDEDE